MGIYPQSDSFTEGATNYGQKLASYMRHLPWASSGDAGSGYAIPLGICDMHDGYSTSYKVAAFRSHSGTGATSHFGAVLWRQAYITNGKASLVFKLNAVSGTITIGDFRQAGVCVRSSTATYSETTGSQYLYDTSGYWLILCNDPGVGGSPEWVLLRVNAGVTTKLASKHAAVELSSVLSGAHKMELEVATVGGNVELTARYDDSEVFSYTDSSGSKITAAGRSGFGLTRDRQVALGNEVTIASRFNIYDADAGTTLLADDFTRANPAANASVTDGNGTVGKVSMSMWTGDIHGPITLSGGSTQVRDPSLNRVESQGSVYNFSQIGASDLFTQARSCIFRKTTNPSETVATGIVLHGSCMATGSIDSGYLLEVVYSSTTYTAVLGRLVGGVPTILATADVSTGYGLGTSSDFKLLASVEDSAGLAGQGPPQLIFQINGNTVVGWTSSVAGISINFGIITDQTADAIFSGPMQAIRIVPPNPGNGSIFYKLWQDEVPPTDTPGEPEDEPSMGVSREAQGITGAYSAPFDSAFSVERGTRIAEQPYETGHVVRLMLDTRQRRRWTIKLSAMTEAERDDLWTFWSAHGRAIPFTWSDPETGEEMAAHFATDALQTNRIGPQAWSYDCVIEELFDDRITTREHPTRKALIMIGRAPTIPLAAPTRKALILRGRAPAAIGSNSPDPKQLTLVGRAPTIMPIQPSRKALILTPRTPTISYGLNPAKSNVVLIGKFPHSGLGLNPTRKALILVGRVPTIPLAAPSRKALILLGRAPTII